MSAAAYRSQIADLLSRLSNNTAAAREWRTVADNRLALIVVLDSAIGAMYSMMLATESQTSLRAPTTEVPLVDPSTHSADEACRFALERLKCCAQYLGLMRRETTSLQSLMLTTLNDGLQALSVQRPMFDLQVSDYPGLTVSGPTHIEEEVDAPLPPILEDGTGEQNIADPQVTAEVITADTEISTALTLFMEHP